MIETIFDHDITRKEIKGLLGVDFEQDEYLKFISSDVETANMNIALLYRIRGDELNMRRYVNKLGIKDAKALVLSLGKDTFSHP